MAGMAIAIPWVLNIDDTMQWAKSGDIRAKNRRKWPKNITNVQKYRPLDIKYLC